MKTKLPRLTTEQAWILNQKVMCNIQQPGFEQVYEEAKRLNQEFIQQYWKLDSIDIYLAITMRSLADIERAERICSFFEQKGFVVYNPGNNCESSRYTKHDLEEKMMAITKGGIVVDLGDKDSGGKFIEACAAKFEHSLPVFFLAENEHQYKVYHDWHPMGVLLGPHVCKTLEELAICYNYEQTEEDFTKKTEVEGKTNEVCINCNSVLYRHNK
jgi:hypothetical protein